MAKSASKPAGTFSVGYGKPPRDKQFKPGQSGNPKGRRRGQSTLGEFLMQEAARLVRVQKGDKIETITRLEGIARKLMQMALEGNLQAARLVMMLLAAEGGEQGAAVGDQTTEVALEANLPDDDVLRRMMARFDHLRSD